MSRFKHWLQDFGDARIIETAIIALALWWSFILILPVETFNSSITYKAMSDFGTEATWSVVFFIFASATFYGMVFDKFKIRMVGLVAIATLWVFISAMFAVSNIATTGTGIYFIIFCLTTYVIYRVGERSGR